MATEAQSVLFRDAILRPVGEGVEQGIIRVGGKVTGFLALEGCRYARGHGLMVVGRAVNGWMGGISPVDLADWNFRENSRISLWKESFPENGSCPMSWVTEQWGPNLEQEYNTRRSPFWRVIHQITGELDICDAGNGSWASYLVWSNLYKVSPSGGENPSGRLESVQYDGCRRLFELEVRDYRPKYLLLLTGEDWAEPFLVKFDIDRGLAGQYVCCTASSTMPDNQDTTVVVATHPRGKPEQDWVEEVIRAFTSRS